MSTYYSLLRGKVQVQKSGTSTSSSLDPSPHHDPGKEKVLALAILEEVKEKFSLALYHRGGHFLSTYYGRPSGPGRNQYTELEE